MSRGERTSRVEPRSVPEEHSESHENIIGSCQVQTSAEASHTEEYAKTGEPREKGLGGLCDGF